MGYITPPKYETFDFIPFPYTPQASFGNSFEFGNSLVKSFNGKEQIQCFQKAFKMFSNYSFVVRAEVAEKMISSFYKPFLFLVPLWYQMQNSKVHIPSGTTIISCKTNGIDWAVASHIFIKSSTVSFEFIEIDSVGIDTVTLKTPTQMGHFLNEDIILSPAFYSFLVSEPKAKEYQEDGLIELDVDFVLKNRYQITIEWTNPVNYYKERLIIELCNSFSGDTNSNTFSSEFELIDLDAGLMRNFIQYDTPPIIRAWGNTMMSYEDVREMITLFQYLKGMQTLIYVPTLRNEFRLIGNVSPNSSYIHIKSMGVSEIFNNYRGSRSIYFVTSEGIFIRDIVSVSVSAPNEEEIELSSPTQYELFAGDCHICWLVLSRSALSTFSIEQESLNNASCSINFIEVRDE